MISKRRVVVLLSCALVAAVGCGKSHASDNARVCQSYCAFVSGEAADARFYANLAESLQSNAANVHPTNDEEAKLMGDQARRNCIQIREDLAIVSSEVLAINAAHAMVSTREMALAHEPVPRDPDCLTASPAQLRSLEKRVADAKKQIPNDDPQCLATCEKDMAAKLAQ